MQPQSNKIIYILLVIILIGVLINSSTSIKSLLPGSAISASSSDNFFDFQSAMVAGKITAVDDNSITVENKSGVTRKLSVGKNISVGSSLPGTPSIGLKNIKIGEIYNISLNSIDGKFEATSIFSNTAPPTTVNTNGDTTPSASLPSVKTNQDDTPKAAATSQPPSAKQPSSPAP